MPDAAQIHRQTEARLNAIARRAFPSSSYHLDFADLAKLGNGDLETGERLLERMFRMSGPRSIHPAALRELGNGNAAIGRRVIEKFLDRLHKAEKPQGHARGGRVGKVSKAESNYRDGFEDNAFCARCRMFREPASCTAVEGRISRTSLCDYFRKA
jgi:hypothetical protein